MWIRQGKSVDGETGALAEAQITELRERAASLSTEQRLNATRQLTEAAKRLQVIADTKNIDQKTALEKANTIMAEFKSKFPELYVVKETAASNPVTVATQVAQMKKILIEMENTNGGSQTPGEFFSEKKTGTGSNVDKHYKSVPVYK